MPFLTGFKLSQDQTGTLLRGYSLDNKEAHELKLTVAVKESVTVNLFEEEIYAFSGKLGAAKILTTKWSYL